MPFNSDTILTRFKEAIAANRLAHAYLLQGTDRVSLRRLGEALAGIVLQGPPERHPDFHRVEPASKSRRIRIEQMRDLEKELRLKAYAGNKKVALICEAERMCVGGGDAANAFLKTLEEPQPGTLLLLTSSAPQLILPTILSRCVRLNIREEGETEAVSEGEQKFLADWFAFVKPGPLRAYARAGLFARRCQELREEIEASIEDEADGEEEENAVKATIEGEFLLARQRLIAALEQELWKQADLQDGFPRPATLQAIRSLETLQSSLLQSVDPALAIERAALGVEGLIPA